MGDTKIEWATKVWNPVTGCTPVSDGCRNCYAERDTGRNLPGHHEPPFSTIRFHPDRLDQPLRWRKPQRIFVCSMGDLFHEDVPMDWVVENIMPVIEKAPRHLFMILTKRPKRMRAVLEYYHRKDVEAIGHAVPCGNLWLGVSVEDQRTVDERIPVLLNTPAVLRFVSVEPMLGAINLTGHHWGAPMIFHLNWIICGTESGPQRRPYPPGGIRSLRDQCVAAGVPIFIKQISIDGKVSKNPSEWQEDLRIREIPK